MAVVEQEAPRAGWSQRFAPKREPLAGAFFWLSAFYLVYCARPEDWIPGLKYIPLAKISAVFALLGLLMSAGKARRKFRDLPREAIYFFGIICLLFVSALLSTVWRGGAFFGTLDFSKALIAWVLTFLVITSFARLKRIIFIQSASVAVITVVSIVKGRSHPRLDGVIGGIYSNPNDLAFAVVLSLPFCLAFLLSARSLPRKAAWMAAILAMCAALFMTASRAGFIELMVTGIVCLWVFGVKGKRMYLIAAAALEVLVVGVAAGGRLKDRFFAISAKNVDSGLEESAHDSYEQRQLLMIESLKGIAHYPWGIGLGNFVIMSGMWREVHVSYLQIAVEGGIASFVLYLLFFARGFANLKQLRRMPSYDPEIDLFAGALYASLIGFVVGAFFAPEAYQLFPYFAVAYTSVLLAIARERQQSNKSQPDLLTRSEPRSGAQARAGELTTVRSAPRQYSRTFDAPLRNQR
jgi:hypothetical protein